MGERTFFSVISPSINLCLSVQVLYSIYMYVCCVHACIYSVHVDACMGGVCVYDTQLCVNVCLHVCFLVWIWERGPEVDVKMSSSAISSHFFSDRVPQ